MRLGEFDYHLPQELIAQEPLEDRAASRMLVLHRKEQRWEDRRFRDLADFLGSGDCLVLNDSRVFPSRLLGHRRGATGKTEVFLLRPITKDGLTWTALVHPGKKMRTGERILFSDDLEADVLGRSGHGERTVRLNPRGELMEVIERVGHVPLPPYIRRPDRPEDRGRYQTVFARERGSVAAPTAGLHFTNEVLDRCRTAGADIAYLTLHVGLGTFQPIREELIEDVRLHTEFFSIAPEEAARIDRANRRIAVGTTSVRTMESAARVGRLSGETELFIYPGFEFTRTDAMLTNFHLPQSSLLILVCAFAGKDFALESYRHAVAERYRFFSYGDCMLIL